MRQKEYDPDDDNQIQPYFIMERPIEELPMFQSHIYNVYSPISIHERVISDDLTHREYYGQCKHCSEEHFLGTLITVCNEPVKLYARIK